MMTVENSPIFVDTNILVYANLAKSPFHLTAKERLRLLSEQGADLWVSRQVLREYLAAMTRRDILTEAIPVSFLVADVRYFAGYFQVAEEDSQVTERLLELMEKVPTGDARSTTLTSSPRCRSMAFAICSRTILWISNGSPTSSLCCR